MTSLALLQAQLAELRAAHSAVMAERDVLSAAKQELAKENDRLRYQVEQLRRLLHGKKSEKIKREDLLPGVLEFFTEEELIALEPKIDGEIEEEIPERRTRRTKRAERKGRMPFPEHLPREVEELELGEEKRECPGCSRTMESIGVEETERLGYIPAKAYVKVSRRHKYACRHCHGGGVLTAPASPHVVPQGRADPDLLASTVVSKFADHLPFYRQAVIFQRQGIDLSDSTLCDYAKEVADATAPLVELMQRRLLSHDYIQSDDTTLKVLDGETPGQSHTARLWAYTRPRDEVVYDFTMTRGRDGPSRFLANYSGILQADGYSGYREVLSTLELRHAACWAHARRYFVRARTTAEVRTKPIIRLLQDLYRVEKRARIEKLSPDARRELRQAHSKPIVARLFEYISMLSNQVLPKSPLGKAIAYTLKFRHPLELYLEDGRVEIDNNWCEQAMRPVALGRRNYLFAGSREGGRRAAILYSLVESARRLGLDPLEYLTDVLRRLPSTAREELDSLTPRGWRRARRHEAAHAAASPSIPP